MRDDEMSSGPLYMGRAVFAPRLPPCKWPLSQLPRTVDAIGDKAIRSAMDAFGGFPYSPELRPEALDADEINRRYEIEPKYIVVNKRTHRIRYESETESAVTIVVEPK